MVVVLAGTVAQAGGDLYQMQARFFRSFIVWWTPGGDLQLPVLPGAYTVGALLLANLIARTAKDIANRAAKPGVLMIHAGVALLMIGQVVADQLSDRSALHLTRGAQSNYSEDLFAQELVLADKNGAVVTVPQAVLASKGEARDQASQLTVRVREFWPNADLSAKPLHGGRRISVQHGTTRNVAYVLSRPVAEDAETDNTPTAVIEVATASESLGTWIVSTRLRGAQRLTHQNRELEISLGPRRHYKPYSVALEDAGRSVHEGTDVARSIWSRVRIQNAQSHDDREVVVAVNKPLQYDGATFYQSQVDPTGQRATLQLVRNPGWPLPYIAFALIAFGVLAQLAPYVRGSA
jgi:ResB-like family